ncbi:MAG: ATP-binding protein, partial [Cellulomonadaceae bacterium]
TALALVLTELVTNAVEHGFRGRGEGTVTIGAERTGSHLRVTIADDGVGLPAEQGPGSGLGSQIVRTLVTNELRGEITWEPRPEGGTSVTVSVELREPGSRRD